MQIVYVFIYTFTIVITILVATLSIFLIHKARQMLVRFWRKYQEILRSDTARYAMMLIFGLIGLVFFESVYTYSILSTHFSRSKSFNIQKAQGS